MRLSPVPSTALSAGVRSYLEGHAMAVLYHKLQAAQLLVGGHVLQVVPNRGHVVDLQPTNLECFSLEAGSRSHPVLEGGGQLLSMTLYTR